jgi:hypothetical protein
MGARDLGAEIGLVVRETIITARADRSIGRGESNFLGMVAASLGGGVPVIGAQDSGAAIGLSGETSAARLGKSIGQEASDLLGMITASLGGGVAGTGASDFGAGTKPKILEQRLDFPQCLLQPEWADQSVEEKLICWVWLQQAWVEEQQASEPEILEQQLESDLLGVVAASLIGGVKETGTGDLGAPFGLVVGVTTIPATAGGCIRRGGSNLLGVAAASLGGGVVGMGDDLFSRKHQFNTIWRIHW